MAQITIDDQKDALATITGAITGITTVYKNRPESLQPRVLPCITMVPKRARYAQRTAGDNHVKITRRWYITVYVQESKAGREFQAEDAVDPFLTRVPDQLGQYPVVRLADGTAFDLSLDGGGDSAAQTLPYGDHDYAAVQFEIETVTEEYVTAV